MYMSAEQQLVNDVAWLPMEQVTTTFVQKPCLAGVVSNAQDLTCPGYLAHLFGKSHLKSDRANLHSLQIDVRLFLGKSEKNIVAFLALEFHVPSN